MTKKRILIAEDEKPMANALSLKLQSVGFEAKIVYDGEAAIAALNESKYDLLILDLVMPKKDGFFVLEELKKLKINIPVIIASNLSQEEDIKRAKDLGAQDYFIKSDTTLLQIVEKVKVALGT